MIGLTYAERQNVTMTLNYAENYDRRRAQIQGRMPSSMSEQYKQSIMLRYQRIRDMHTVCSVNSSYDDDFKSSDKPEFIQACIRKQKKYNAEMNMLVMAFPFLANIQSYYDNDI
jgi:hypothetical protein